MYRKPIEVISRDVLENVYKGIMSHKHYDIFDHLINCYIGTDVLLQQNYLDFEDIEEENKQLKEIVNKATKEIDYTLKILKNTNYMLSKRDLIKELSNYLEILDRIVGENNEFK